MYRSFLLAVAAMSVRTSNTCSDTCGHVGHVGTLPNSPTAMALHRKHRASYLGTSLLQLALSMATSIFNALFNKPNKLPHRCKNMKTISNAGCLTGQSKQQHPVPEP